MRCECGKHETCIKRVTITGAGVVGRTSENWLACGKIQADLKKYKNIKLGKRK